MVSYNASFSEKSDDNSAHSREKTPRNIMQNRVLAGRPVWYEAVVSDRGELITITSRTSGNRQVHVSIHRTNVWSWMTDVRSLQLAERSSEDPAPARPMTLPNTALAQMSMPHADFFTLLDLCVSSLRRGHANLLCIVPILTDDPRRESSMPHADLQCSRLV